MAPKAKRVAIYARVSTKGQTVEHQIRELREVAANKGWTVVQEYADEGISGTKGRDKRPQFDAMLKDATRAKFGLVMAWSIDRLGRSLSGLVQCLDELRSHDCNLYLHQQAIDTTSPSQRAFLHMAAVFAEFERDIIVERVNAGLATARAKGVRLGRPQVADKVEARIRKLRAEGLGQLKIAKQLGCGVGTVRRVLAEAGIA
ncbi:MAG: recombinase family protein [Xanthomonadales bacterium]|nr:recombinase family protein [Xanthomonadales bacterium]